MKAKILTILLTSFLIINVFSQEGDMVHFFSNKKITIVTLEEFNTGLYGTKLTVNGNVLDADKVDFIQKDGQLFTNLINVYRNKFLFFNSKKASVFIPRTKKGKLNIYEKEVTVTESTTSGRVTSRESFIDYYYNESEFGEIKKANYKNLNIKLKSNKTAYKSLVKYRNLNITGKVFGYTGAAGIVGSLSIVTYELIKNGTDNPNVNNYIIAGAIIAPSLVMVFGSKLVKKPKRNALKRALESFNK